MRRRVLPILAMVLGAALGLVLLFRPTAADRVKSQLLAIAAAVRVEPTDLDPRARALRIQHAFGEALAPEVKVSLGDDLLDGVARDDAERSLSRDRLSGMAAAAPESWSQLGVEIDGIRVTVDRIGESAAVDAIATVHASPRDGPPQHERRRLIATFERADGVFRLTSITLRAVGTR
jgi:hypothetical protein